MIVNRNSLLAAAPIQNMHSKKMYTLGTSFGLSEAGYDIRINETVTYYYHELRPWVAIYNEERGGMVGHSGRFILASAMEVFQMPLNLVGTVKDKSSWARQGVSVFNTVIEPGWNGILTLELVFNGNKSFTIPAGAGIAQVLFARLECNGDYGDGKYQNAEGIEEAKF